MPSEPCTPLSCSSNKAINMPSMPPQEAKPQTIESLRRRAIAELQQSGYQDPRLAVDLLLCFILQQERSFLYSHSTDPIALR